MCVPRDRLDANRSNLGYVLNVMFIALVEWDTDRFRLSSLRLCGLGRKVRANIFK